MQILRETSRLAIAVSMASALLASEGSDSIPSVGARPSGDTGPGQGRECIVAPVPKTVPGIATVMDADTVRRAIAAELAGTPARGPMLFSIRFDKDGETEWVERIGNEAGGVAQESGIQRLIAAHLKKQPSAKEAWSLRLQVVPGDSVQLRLSRSEVCPAERIASGGSAIGSRVGTMSMQDIAELQRAGSFRIGVDISATGEVLRVELLQTSGSRIQDDIALEGARAARYRPALVDGIPVAVRYEIRSRAGVRVRTRSIRRSRPD